MVDMIMVYKQKKFDDSMKFMNKLLITIIIVFFIINGVSAVDDDSSCFGVACDTTDQFDFNTPSGGGEQIMFFQPL